MERSAQDVCGNINEMEWMMLIAFSDVVVEGGKFI